MKKVSSTLLAALSAALFLLLPGAAKAAGITTQFQTNSVTGVGVDFVFNTFNQQLGTLYAVTFSILNSTDSGSFYVQNNNLTSITVKNPRDFLTVIDNQATGGDYNGNMKTLVTTPTTGSVGFTLAGNSNQTFTVTPISLIGAGPVDANLSSFLSQYESADGLTTVSFNAMTAPSVTVIGGLVTQDFTGVNNNTIMSLTYSYDAVPEPSTYVLALSGLAVLAVVMIRRRKAALLE